MSQDFSNADVIDDVLSNGGFDEFPVRFGNLPIRSFEFNTIFRCAIIVSRNLDLGGFR